MRVCGWKERREEEGRVEGKERRGEGRLGGERKVRREGRRERGINEVIWRKMDRRVHEQKRCELQEVILLTLVA